MEAILGVLAFMVSVLAVLQGWQMHQARRNRHNPGDTDSRLDVIIAQMGRMEQRLNDIWDKVKD